MIISYFLSHFFYFLSDLIPASTFAVNDYAFYGGLEVWSYGVYIFGGPLFTLIMTSFVGVFTFKLLFSVINWVWQQLPLT